MEGKDFAEIYDFITLPRRLEDISGLTDDEIRSEKRLVKNELNRLTELEELQWILWNHIKWLRK